MLISQIIRNVREQPFRVDLNQTVHQICEQMIMLSLYWLIISCYNIETESMKCKLIWINSLISECWFSIYGNHFFALFTERYRKKNGALNLILFMLGNFSRFFVVCWFFFKINFFEKFFVIYHSSVKQIGNRSGQTFCRAQSGSNLWANNASRQRVKLKI